MLTIWRTVKHAAMWENISKIKLLLNLIYDDQDWRSVLMGTNTKNWVVTDLMEMHAHVFLFTVGAYWAEFIRFHPPQRHQQGEGTTGVIRAVPPPAPCWCCKWVFCFIREKDTTYTDTKTGTKWGINAVCVQLGLRYSRRPPLGRPSWAPEPGEPSSAGWSTVRWLGSMKTKSCFPVLQKRKVSSDWPKSFFSIFTLS